MAGLGNERKTNQDVSGGRRQPCTRNCEYAVSWFLGRYPSRDLWPPITCEDEERYTSRWPTLGNRRVDHGIRWDCLVPRSNHRHDRSIGGSTAVQRTVCLSAVLNQYIRLGQEEAFLLQQLDGTRTYGSIAESFVSRFQEEVTAEEIRQFVRTAQRAGLILRRDDDSQSADAAPTSLWQLDRIRPRSNKSANVYLCGNLC